MTKNIIDLFIQIVEEFPDHTAIMTNGTERLTYAGLYRQAQNIAHLVPRGGVVAISLDKSSDYIAAMLACWLAGAAFMPLDPALPEDRRDFILDDAKPDLILTHDMIRGLPDRPFDAIDIQPDNVAYIIYTSGSTGKPKGVIVTHSGLVPMLQAQIAAFGLTPQSRSLFYLSTNFDASVSDIGTALLSGAALCIETGEKLNLAANLTKIVDERGITYMDIPPSLLRLLDPQTMPESLDTIVIGGEPCPPEIVRHWAKHVRMINVYGPTEATVCTSLCLCDPETWSKPLIGDPLPGVEYIIIDEELYIGGRQLAAGYLNRPELTAQKFITREGRRLYRTGDKVFRHDDGSIEFIGRIDRQVKLRGQLIELEEIESHIRTHPQIGKVAVIKRTVDGRDALIAFVTRTDGRMMDRGELQSILKPVLPSWMIPTYVVSLNDMPLTNTGKIDISVLNNQEIPLSETEHNGHVAPVNDTERMLQDIWQRVLKREKIGCHDHFASVGGDSMATLELTLEAESRGLHLTPAIILEFPTISGQAAWIDRKGQDSLASAAMTADALKRDVEYNDELRSLINQAGMRPYRPAFMQHVFFTGATGFLGKRLLRDLLEKTDADFYPLVRATTEKEARTRLDLDCKFDDRIHPVCGDLLDGPWPELSDTIDSIIHCGATVNMVLPYDDLRAVNVEGTENIMRLACTGRRKTIHYASTLSVFVSTDQNTGNVSENDRLDQTKTVYGGYGQSKWAAEYLLQHIPAGCADTFIYRLGLITGDTVTGQTAGHDFLNMFIKGIVSLGCVPDGPHDQLMVDVTPLDYAVSAMSHVIRTGSPATYHIANRKGFSLAQILHGLDRKGYAIKTLPVSKWQSFIEQRQLTPAESAAFMALCRCLPENFYARYRVMDLFQATNIVFESANTDAALKSSGIDLPAADDRLLDLYLRQALP